MATYVFDLESDGLLEQATRIHSLVLKDVDDGQVFSFYRHGDVEGIWEGVELLMAADCIIGHNIINFDIPLIKKIHPEFSIDGHKVIDTLVCSRLVWSDISDIDHAKRAKGKLTMPGKLTGSHSLAAWGYRLGEHKGDYQGGWECWSEEMQRYCEQDVEVTDRLWKLIKSKTYSDRAIELEHQVAWIVAQQERNGFLFDLDKARILLTELVQKRDQLEAELQDTFKPWWSPDGEQKVPKRSVNYKDKKRGSVTKDSPFTPVKNIVFNPGSRDQIADRLVTLRGWKPKEFTPSGKPKVDETTLSKLPWPEAKRLAEYFMVQKRIGQLSEGDNSWLRLVKDTGRIHHHCITNGAVSGRATHRNPNLAQCPAVGSPYGAECRELFTVPDGCKLVGVDLSGIELRMLGHFMAKYDNGKYAKEVVDGDIHTVNQEAAGLPDRNAAKKFIYMFLYGAGPPRLAHDLNLKSAREGAKLKNRFLAKTPALARLIEDVQSSAEKRGNLIGLDGRLLRVRSSHAALNTLLQSAAALISKRWMVELHTMLEDEGISGVKQLAWVHDELQIEVPELAAQRVGELAVKSIGLAGEFFDMKVALTGEYKIGNNWKETH